MTSLFSALFLSSFYQTGVCPGLLAPVRDRNAGMISTLTDENPGGNTIVLIFRSTPDVRGLTLFMSFRYRSEFTVDHCAGCVDGFTFWGFYGDRGSLFLSFTGRIRFRRWSTLLSTLLSPASPLAIVSTRRKCGKHCQQNHHSFSVGKFC